jgi:tRNA dimethylallyltransferase
VTESNLSEIIVICGPTGVGKTGFALALARQFAAEIIGADSMQIYRCMDIGTAKPTESERAAVPHHMVDVVDPDQPFDAAAYADQAAGAVGRILARGKLPLVVGGTGLYIKSLIYGLFSSRRSDPDLRQRLTNEAGQKGAAALHQRLSQHDPEAAARIHPNDTYRLVRALEVLELTGHSISDHHNSHGFARPRYHALKIGLTLPRDQLYARIDQRVDAMIAAGFTDEVRDLLAKGYGPELKAMQSLGYRHLTDFIQGRLEWTETLRTLKRDHRRYAKRQMTWFGADASVNWLAPDALSEAVERVQQFISS